MERSSIQGNTPTTPVPTGAVARKLGIMAKQISVVYLVDHLGLGGAQTVLRDLLRYSNLFVVRPEVWSLHGRIDGAGPFSDLGITSRALVESRWDPRLPWILRRELRRHRPAILHAHLVVSCALAEFAAPAIPGMSIISHVHNHFGKHGRDQYQEWIEPHLYRRARAVICCSTAVEKSVRIGSGGRARKLITIPNGVDDDKLQGRREDVRARVRAEWRAQDKDLVLISASRLNPEKDLGYALEVVAQLRRTVPDFLYVIAGSGPCEEEWRARAAQLGIGENVRWLGYRDDVSRLLHGADVFLMPSLYEGLPMALVESMGADLTPAITPFDGHRDLLEDGRTGVLIPFGDAAAAAERLAVVAGNAALRRSIGMAARRSAQAHFSASVMARRVERLYLRMTLPRDPRPARPATPPDHRGNVADPIPLTPE